MNTKENSNKKLNEHKTKTNELIRPINNIIKNLSNLNPTYSKIENIVEAYRDKIYEIYTDLDKQGIDFWSDDFLLGDIIRYHLETEMYYSIEELFDLATSITSKRKIVGFINKAKKQSIDKLLQKNEYIKNYNINANIYESLLWYYNIIEASRFQPKEIIYSYIGVKNCFKLIKNCNALSKEQEKEIIQIIERKELECIEYRKKYKQLLELLKNLTNEESTSNNIENNRIKIIKK